MKKYIFIYLLSFSTVFAQKTALQTHIDTVKNKIGAQFTLSLKVKTQAGAVVVFPGGKSFGALEVIRSYPVDTIKATNQQELIKRYGLTQFDSGRYVIPRLPVKIGSTKLFSDSIAVVVNPVQVDTIKQKLYDIKDIHTAPSKTNWFLYLLFALLGGIIYGGYWYWKKKRKLSTSVIEAVYKTPIEKATVLLQQLENKELIRQGEVKKYYSELTDIARNYIEEAISIPAMESTTAELIVKLKFAAAKKNIVLTPETLSKLEQVLQQADLVKFAKERPQDFEIASDRQKIETTLITINNALPIAEDAIEDPQNQEFIKIKYARELQRQKRKKWIMISSVSLVLLTTTLLILSYFGHLNLISSRNTRLLNGDWVQSEYGNPGILIETPEVLVRQDPGKLLNPNAIAILKEFQMFGYGSALENLYILVATFKYKKASDLNLETIVEGNLKELEAKGATNLVVKKDAFSTKAGISGIRAFGTMSVVDGLLKRSNKVYYEMLLFKQEQGLQQVLVWYPEGDESGAKIVERIIESVELQVGAQ